MGVEEGEEGQEEGLPAPKDFSVGEFQPMMHHLNKVRATYISYISYSQGSRLLDPTLYYLQYSFEEDKAIACISF